MGRFGIGEDRAPAGTAAHARSPWLAGVAAWIFFLLVAVVAVGANPFASETSTPLDLLASYRGWGAQVEKADVRHPQRSDALDARLPQWMFARNELRQGRLPLWNDTSAGGDAGILKLTSGQLTPAFAVFAAAPDPAVGFYLAVLLNLTLAGVGMFFFLRRYLAIPAALFGGVAFELCGFIAAWLYWSHVLTLVWLPWILWSLHRVCSERGPGAFASASVFTALMVLGGFPFVAELCLGTAFLFLLTNAVPGDAGPASWKGAAGIMAMGLGALLAGMFIAAIPIWTFVQWLQQFDISYRGTGTGLDLVKHSRLALFPWAHQALHVERSFYVGTIGALLAGTCVLLSPVAWKRNGRLYAFSLALLFVAACLAFKLPPREWLSWVPGLSNNSWGRSIALLDFALCCLAAMGMDIVARSMAGRSRIAAIALVTGLLLLQLTDQLAFFRKFNGETDAENFYPVKDSVAFAKRKLGPFDYVMADSAVYMVSGSLGGVGVREWHSHRFKEKSLNDALRKLVKGAARSPTAQVLRGKNFLIDAPEMALFNVRYLLLSPSLRSLEGAYRAESLLPSLPHARWAQPFRLREPKRVQRLEVRLRAMGGRSRRSNDGEATLDAEIRSADGRERHRSSVLFSTVRNGGYTSFPFENELRLPPGNYTLWIRLRRAGAGGREISAGTLPRERGVPGVRVNGKPWDGLLDYRLVADGQEPPLRSSDAPFRLVFAGESATVWENAHSPNGPYFLRRLRSTAKPESSGVAVLGYAPTEFRIAYTGGEDGYVVVPMDFTPDWRVRVGGEQVEPRIVNGVMPAVPVSGGGATIVFTYEPLPAPLLVCWLAGMIAGGIGLVWWRRGRGRDSRIGDLRTNLSGRKTPSGHLQGVE